MSNSTEDKIKPIAIPGIHERFYKFLYPILDSYEKPKILDLGAGHGAMVRNLYKDGYDITAADLFPEYFHFNKIKCHKVDITQKLPFEDNSFDVILAVELMEHVHDHQIFFNEANRILKKGGSLLFSTPNILSLKSRVRFLFSGFYFSFIPLEHERNDGLQHISSLTVDQYKNLAVRSNFSDFNVTIDKQQRTSRWLSFLVPFIRLYCKLKSIDYDIHNRYDLLTGRVLFARLTK